MTIAVAAARTALVGFFASVLLLSPSVGYLALQERDWFARGVMFALFVGLAVSVYLLGFARERARLRAS